MTESFPCIIYTVQADTPLQALSFDEEIRQATAVGCLTKPTKRLQPCWLCVRRAFMSGQSAMIVPPGRAIRVPERSGNHGHRTVARRRRSRLSPGKQQLTTTSETTL
jgi:hypothetical protein